MTEEQAAQMLTELSAHYRQPVMPIKRFCTALETWARVIRERDNYDSEQSRTIDATFLSIRKSNLLARMLYDGEALRAVKCPEHQGRWSGIGPCQHGCDSTGWVQEGWPDSAPRCTKHPDRPAVSRTVSVHAATDDCWECNQDHWGHR